MTSTTSTPHTVPPEAAQVESGSPKARAKKYRRVAVLANQVQVFANGTRLFVRFGQAEILEHWVLLIVVAALTITGLLEKFAGIDLVATAIRYGFGDLSNVRRIHNLAAPILMLMLVYHALRVLSFWLIAREAGALMPRGSDIKHFFAQIGYTLGLSRSRPDFGRYTIGEKLSYWSTLVFMVGMSLTGLVQWFPVQASQYLSNDALQWSRALHNLFTLLAVALLLPWHLYSTVLRARNTSIFTGLMSEAQMRRDHPLEYQETLKAYEEIQNYIHNRAAAHESAPAQQASSEPVPGESAKH